jgi:hypothetical protein
MCCQLDMTQAALAAHHKVHRQVVPFAASLLELHGQGIVLCDGVGGEPTNLQDSHSRICSLVNLAWHVYI